MLRILLILFLLVAAAGIALALLEHRGRALPLKLSSLHGVAALTLLTLLVVHDFAAPTDMQVNSATLVLVLAALGGLFLFGFRASRQKLPLAVVLLHGAFALAGVSLLALGAWRG